MIGGDTFWKRDLYGPPKHISAPKVKLILISNYLIEHKDPGFNRRSKFIIMDNKFTNEKKDNDIKNKMLEHKEEFKEFILNYKNEKEKQTQIINKINKIDKIVFENIKESKFKYLDVINNNGFETIIKYIEDFYGIQSKENAVKLSENNATESDIFNNNEFSGVYVK